MTHAGKTLLSVVVAALLVCSAVHGEELEKPTSVSFIRDVAPILVANCSSCHGKNTSESNYRLDTFDLLMQPGDYGAPPVTAGDLADSQFHRLITSEFDEERMPYNGGRLSDAEIERIDSWILQGATFDGQDAAAPLKDQLPSTIHPPAPTTYSSTIPVTALTQVPQ